MTHSGRLLTDAIIEVLEAADIAVGDALAPDAPFPYAVVGPLAGGTLSGPVDKPRSEAEVLYQVSSYGRGVAKGMSAREQAEWLADKVRTALFDTPLSVPNRRVGWLDQDMLGGVMRDPDAEPPVWYVPDRFRVWTAPA